MRRSILKFAAVAMAVSSFTFNATAQELQQQTWKMALPTAERSWFGGLHKWWGTEVEKRSGGKIKIQYFWSDSLVKWPDALPGIQSGVADIAWVNSSWHAAQLPNYLALDHMFNIFTCLYAHVQYMDSLRFNWKGSCQSNHLWLPTCSAPSIQFNGLNRCLNFWAQR
jgi:TRAP-type C4-dicarboxylate transport system substrate-binding protein